MLTDKQKLKYYKNKQKAHKIIQQKARKRKHIIYGARALNAYFPTYLDKPTEDWDIYAKNPKRAATRTEKRLDKAFGGDYFYVEPAQHPGTYKVKSRVTRSGIADYTKPDKKIPYTTMNGQRYIELGHVKQHIKKTLKDPSASFRWEKDREALQRIQLYEKYKREVKRRNPKAVPMSFQQFSRTLPNIRFNNTLKGVKLNV